MRFEISEDSGFFEELFVQFVVVTADVDEIIDTGGTPGGFIVAGRSGDQQGDFGSRGFHGRGERGDGFQISRIVRRDNGDAGFTGGERGDSCRGVREIAGTIDDESRSLEERGGPVGT